MGDIKKISYPFIIILKGSGKEDEINIFDNELSLISLDNCVKKGYEWMEFITFDSSDGAENWYVEYYKNK